MPGRLDGKVVIITGAGTGIGEAIALKFAQEGARVCLNGLPGDPIDDVADRIVDDGGQAIAYAGDVSDEPHARACVSAAIDRWGRLDVLVNNAGVFLAVAETDDYPIDKFDETIKNNVRSCFLMTRFALPHLRKTKGNIVSAGSEAGFNGVARNSPYGGTKAFVHAFMKGVAVEQGKHGVRANCVCPGPTDTAWTHAHTGPMDKEMARMLTASIPFGRLGTPEEIANVYAFLASDEASFVTGALWLADGGITIAHGPVGEKAKRAAKSPPRGRVQERTRHQHEGERGKRPVTVGKKRG